MHSACLEQVLLLLSCFVLYLFGMYQSMVAKIECGCLMVLVQFGGSQQREENIICFFVLPNMG